MQGELIREWRCLIDRGARLGLLPLEPLREIYASLREAGSSGDPRARMVDAAALERAWRWFPPAAWDSAELMLQRRLPGPPAGDPQAPLRWTQLADGGLVGEAADGEALHAWALHWCEATHELHKAHALWQAAQQAGHAAAADGASLARLGFVWGLDLDTLTRLEPALRARMQRPPAPLCLVLPPALAPQAQRQAGLAAGRALLERLAEQGLAARPLHLHIGATTLLDCLSPYLRDLAAELCAWAGRPQQAVEAAELIELGRRFLAADARLVPERQAAERQVGIYAWPLEALAGASPTAPLAHAVDLQRLDRGACDAHLRPFVPSEAGAVLLCLPALPAPQLAALLETLLSSLHRSVRSIALCAAGVSGLPAAGQPPGRHAPAWPSVLASGDGSELMALPPTRRWAAAVGELLGQPTEQGLLWSSPSRALAAAFGAPLSEALGAPCIDTQAAAVLAACAQAELRFAPTWAAELTVAVLPPQASTALQRTVDLGYMEQLGSLAVAPPARDSAASPRRTAPANDLFSPDQVARRSVFWALRLKA